MSGQKSARASEWHLLFRLFVAHRLSLTLVLNFSFFLFPFGRTDDTVSSPPNPGTEPYVLFHPSADRKTVASLRLQRKRMLVRATTGVVTRVDLVEGCGFTGGPPPPLARGTRAAGGPAPSPFSLAAYIILPIERHTSFPLYVSIYNSWRKTFAARARTKRCGWICGERGPSRRSRRG